MSKRKTKVIDLIIQADSGPGYQPVMIRTYARACTLPDGTMLTDYLRDLESRLETVGLNNPEIKIPALGEGFEDTTTEDTSGTEDVSGEESAGIATASMNVTDAVPMDYSAEIQRLEDRILYIERWIKDFQNDMDQRFAELTANMTII